MKYEIRVIFGDTDQMGVVYYANYLRFFEGARAEYWRSLGRTHKDLDDAQVAIPVIEAHCKYQTPARYEDVLAIDIQLTELRGASFKFTYVVTRGPDRIAEGWTRHAVIGPTGRPRAIPEFIRELIRDDRAR